MAPDSTSEEEFDYAWRRIVLAKNHITDNRERLDCFSQAEGLDEIEAEDLGMELFLEQIILDSQLSIESSAKAAFKLTGKNFPTQHDIGFNDDLTKGLVHEIPEEYENTNHILRVIFLTQVWERFYLMSKYGIEQFNLDPRTIIHKKDAERAIEDSEACVAIVEDYLDFVIREYDFDDPRSATDVDFTLTKDFYSFGSD